MVFGIVTKVTKMNQNITIGQKSGLDAFLSFLVRTGALNATPPWFSA
jgi:hypothetical protein